MNRYLKLKIIMKRFFVSSLATLVFALGAYLLPAPSWAQFDDVRQHLHSLPHSRVYFGKGKTGTTIQNATNTIYILGAKAGQKLTLKLNSLGAVATVTLYGVDGKPLSPVFSSEDEGKTFTVVLPLTGDYYIVGGSGTSNARYDFTVSIL